MRIAAVVKKEFRQISRDFLSLFLIVVVPAQLLIVFGYALSFDVRHIKTAVCDQDKSPSSRELVASLAAGEYFDVIKYVQSPKEADALLDRGDASVVLVFPQGFGEKLESGSPSSLQALIDGSNSQNATIIKGYLNGFAQSYSLGLISKFTERKGYGALKLPVDVQPRVWFNPELKSSIFLIPGLIVFILMVSSAISTSLSVVREKERGTMEQLLVSPLTPYDVILGKTIPYVLIAQLSMFCILLVGAAVFDVPVRGSFLVLFVSSTLFILCALGQGILISTITGSQQVAYQIAALTTILPSTLLSGFIFPIRNMPIAIQMISYMVPGRYFVETLRAILLKGAPLEAYWQQLLALFVFAAVMLGLATIRMAKAKLV